jgi:hypothetical protein
MELLSLLINVIPWGFIQRDFDDVSCKMIKDSIMIWLGQQWFYYNLLNNVTACLNFCVFPCRLKISVYTM